MKGPIRVLITDDHAIVRKGLTMLLATERDMKVVGEAQDGQEAVEKAGSLKPDVVLMDLVMPRMDGIEATRKITETHPEVKVLVLTSFAADDKVFPAVKAGALGYLLKDSSPEECRWKRFQTASGENDKGPCPSHRQFARHLHGRNLSPCSARG